MRGRKPGDHDKLVVEGACALVRLPRTMRKRAHVNFEPAVVIIAMSSTLLHLTLVFYLECCGQQGMNSLDPV